MCIQVILLSPEAVNLMVISLLSVLTSPPKKAVQVSIIFNNHAIFKQNHYALIYIPCLDQECNGKLHLPQLISVQVHGHHYMIQSQMYSLYPGMAEVNITLVIIHFRSHSVLQLEYNHQSLVKILILFTICTNFRISVIGSI